MARSVQTGGRKTIPPAKGPHRLPERGAAGTSPWLQASFTWRESGRVNIAHEAVDRHLEEGRGEKTALIYLDDVRRIEWNFRQLKERSDQYASLCLSRGLNPGDRVFIFLPKIPELYAAMIGVVKAGGVVGPLFDGFFADSLRDRLADSAARFLITDLELAERVPYAELPDLEEVWVLRHDFPAPAVPAGPAQGQENYLAVDLDPKTIFGIELPPGRPRFLDLEASLDRLLPVGDAVTSWLDLEDGYIIHYTSGSTGKPKGILHAHRAMIQLSLSGAWVLDLRDEDVYWCTAHPGWVTGSAYGVFAPWLNGATIVVNGGRFSADGWYNLIDELGISVLYSAPTAFRMLMSAGRGTRDSYKLDSLRHILSVGEPLNPELISWALDNFAQRIHDTWWMTETGAQLVANLPCDELRPGSMGLPLPGIEVAILDPEGKELAAGQPGQLAVKTPWPAMMKTVWKQPERFQSYFLDLPGRGRFYLSGDSAYLDQDGRVWFLGRADDMIVSNGEKVSPFEVESSLIEHPAVAEAAVIGKPDQIRGSIVKAFVVLREGRLADTELAEELKLFVKTRLSAHAYPREVEILGSLPKTRASGKIMRRVLKAWELDQDPGDTSTLENSERKTLARA